VLHAKKLQPTVACPYHVQAFKVDCIGRRPKLRTSSNVGARNSDLDTSRPMFAWCLQRGTTSTARVRLGHNLNPASLKIRNEATSRSSVMAILAQPFRPGEGHKQNSELFGVNWARTRAKSSATDVTIRSVSLLGPESKPPGMGSESG